MSSLDGNDDAWGISEAWNFNEEKNSIKFLILSSFLKS